MTLIGNSCHIQTCTHPCVVPNLFSYSQKKHLIYINHLNLFQTLQNSVYIYVLKSF